MHLIDTEVIFDPTGQYDVGAAPTPSAAFVRTLLLLRQQEFAFTSMHPLVDPFNPPSNVRHTDTQHNTP